MERNFDGELAEFLPFFVGVEELDKEEEVEPESPTDDWGEREVVDCRDRNRFSPLKRKSNLIARRERRLGGVTLCIVGGVGIRETPLLGEAGRLLC